MFVHVKYGNECGDCVMEYNSNHFITVNNVIEKARLTYGKCSILQLFNEHGSELYSQVILGIPHRGVFMRDTLPWQLHSVECGIVNLNRSSQPGSHWVCYYRNKDDRIYFDSYCTCNWIQKIDHCPGRNRTMQSK